MVKETIYLPNEIFKDLQNTLESSKHIAFAYTYYYYICYLYRYCKYSGSKITQQDIKEYLGYAGTYKAIDFIIKKLGIMDTIGYTVTTTDYPLRWEYDPEEMTLIFYTIADMRDMDLHHLVGNDRNFKIKYPVKAFYRDNEDQGGDIKTGTFYDIRNTHGIAFESFEAIVQNRKLGTMGFYIYGFIKRHCDMFPAGYKAAITLLARKLKVGGVASVSKYVLLLEKHHFITIERKPVSEQINDKTAANTYKILR